jgi:phospholipid/cholesterol/gamma-HCH transport system substrate-binding protein
MKRRDEVTVGILLTVAVAILILGTLWLARGGLKSGYPVYTRFAWGQNLKQGQPVLLAGFSIGYVSDVVLRRDGYLDVMLRIDDDQTIPKGSTATVKPVGVFGDVAVALTPPLPPPQVSYAPGDTIPPGAPTPDIGQIMTRVDSIGQSVERLSHAIEVEVVQAGTLRDIHKTVAAAAAFSTQLQGLVEEQNKNLTITLASFRGAADKVSRSLDSTKIDAALANLRTTSENAARLVANLDSTNTQARHLLDLAERGNGTLGKVLTDSTLYSDMRGLIRQVDSLIADVKRNPRKYINVKIF